MSESQAKPKPNAGGRAKLNMGASPMLQAGSRINRSTLMMGLMFAVGIGWVIWESRQIKTPTDDPDAEVAAVMVDSGLSAMTKQTREQNQRANDVQRIVQAFYQEPQHKQVPLSALAHNPFVDEMNLPVPEVEAPEQPEKTPDTTTVEKEKAPPVTNLHLRSTMLSGNRPTAMISGYIVYEGQIINGWKIEEIKSGYVVLRWKTQMHVLKLP